MEELVDLVRGDVDDDAAIVRRLPEPVGPHGPLLVRPDPDRLEHPADRAAGDDMPGLDRRRHGVALGEADREDAAGLGDGGAHLGKLVAGGEAGLVDHHVLAGPHRPDGEAGAVARDRRDADDVDARVGEDGVAVELRGVGVGLAELLDEGRQRGLRAVADELGPGVLQAIDVAEDVAVVDPHGGEAQHSDSPSLRRDPALPAVAQFRVEYSAGSTEFPRPDAPMWRHRGLVSNKPLNGLANWGTDPRWAR